MIPENPELPLADTDASSFAMKGGTPDPPNLLSPPVYRRHQKRKSSTIYVPPRAAADEKEPDIDRRSGKILIKGATTFAGAQLLAKLTTFFLNQLLLRCISTTYVGAGSQVELAVTTILSISRDGIRLSSQRRSASDGRRSLFTPQGQAQYNTPRGLLQETVNLGWLAVLFGSCVTLAVVSGLFCFASWPKLALGTTALACLVELLTEPCFLLMQWDMRLGVRARAEGIANVAKVVCVAIAMIGFRTRAFTGFACGQLAYSAALAGVYYSAALGHSASEGFSLLPQRILMSNTQRFINPATFNSVKEFGKQQLVKYFLTEGDRLAVGFMASLEEQGEYTLAVNYGSLVARFMLYPIEEALRACFTRTKDVAVIREVITNVLRGYSYMMLLCTLFGTYVAKYALTTFLRIENPNVANVLSAYCWYIPIISWNGSLEALIHANMSLTQVKSQVRVLGIVACVFVALVYIFLSLLHTGSVGLVYAQIGSSFVRLLWSASAVSTYFGSSVWVFESSPNWFVLLLSVALSSVTRLTLYPVVTFRAFIEILALAFVVLVSAVVAERRGIEKFIK